MANLELVRYALAGLKGARTNEVAPGDCPVVGINVLIIDGTQSNGSVIFEKAVKLLEPSGVLFQFGEVAGSERMAVMYFETGTGEEFKPEHIILVRMFLSKKDFERMNRKKVVIK